MPQGGERGAKIYRSFSQQTAGSWNIKGLPLIKENHISQVKERRAFLYMWRCKVCAHWNHSFCMHLSFLGPVSCISHPEFPHGSPSGVATVWWLLDGRYSLLSWVPSGFTSSYWRTAIADDYGDQSWVFFGRSDAKAETPVLWPPHAKCWLIGKDSDAGRDWEQEEKGTTEARWLMAPLTQWTWVWVNSGSWWWTGRPGVLQFMGLQRVGHNWVTELNWTDLFQHGSLQFKNFRCSILFDAYHCHISESSSVVFDSLQLMNYTIHGIVQARILEWVAISFSRRYSWPRDQVHISCIGRWILYQWAPWESQNCSSVQFSLVTQLCPTLCNPMNCSTPGLPVHH